ncbi:hypothetical protein [Sphingosinicella sp.]|uniref:hypothetical protein n=1 Tax=Sphingosinicella sp. TaxID=1917971 RepID=UPI0040378678
MSKQSDSGWRNARRIDDEAKGVFLAELKRGLLMENAARAAGFSGGAFWKARKRDPAFDEAVEEALELSNTPRFISAGNGRPLQLRRIRRLRFEPWRQEVFFAHFAGTCDETAAAEAAGVSTSTICRHRQKDPDFAARYQAALEQGVVRLEAEALRQRLLAQQQLRDGLIPEGEIAQEFERVLKLLQRFDRKGGGVGVRQVSRAHLKAWTFEEAIEAIERKLRAIGIPIREDEEADEE